MKRALFAFLAVTLLVGLAGCCHDRMTGPNEPCGVGCLRGSCQRAPETAAECGRPGCGCRDNAYTPGPPVGTVTYPYYTLRGPRDFLARNPSSIGP